MRSIVIELAGIPVKIDNISENTYRYLYNFKTDEEPLEEISITAAEVEERYSRMPQEWEIISAEHAVIIDKVTDKIVKYERAVFHSCAFYWKGKAWLFTAPSGTGKSTQFARWMLRYPDEVKAMNGDKPLIGINDDEVMVYASPWKGKEEIGSMLSAPLGGIICLRQGEENRIERLDKEASIVNIFTGFLFATRSEDIIRKLVRIDEKIVSSTPIWILTNRGDFESAELTHDTLMEYLGGKQL